MQPDENSRMTPSKITALEVLTEMSAEGVEAISRVLNDEGIVLEGGETSLSSTIVKYWESACEGTLRNHGYTCGPVRTAAEFFPGYGMVCALFDESRITYQEALAALKRARDLDPEVY